MGYEPELNDPVFYEVEGEPELTRCFRCSSGLEADDIIWANDEGQIVKEGNDTAWCVTCLPMEVIMNLPFINTSKGESNE